MPDREIEVVLDENVYLVKVPEQLVREAGVVFEKFDRDMARGWQMSREWVATPNTKQRCQIVADRLLTAIYQERHQFIGMACAYIARNLPETKRIIIDTDGDMTQTAFE